MSVITKEENTNNYSLYCKGSPEKISELSNPDSLPHNFQNVLSSFTKQGFRVIAIAYKTVNLDKEQIKNADRDQLEFDLTLLGLIIMENKLKPETTPIIGKLNSAKIRTIMCTGDNILTGLKVAADCDLIKKNDRMILVEAESGKSPVFTYPDMSVGSTESNKSDNYYFACTGKSFEVIRSSNKELLHKLAVRGKVFARMSPEQKQQLVEILQNLGYYVGMCGDGANDCGALKTAHAGVSLSEAEASIASPFTSKRQNISCVPDIISEGRATLVSSFGLIKFIVMYSLTQFFSVLILYTINAGLTDLEFLYIDLFLATLLSFVMSRTEAYAELYPKPPPNKLIAWRPILSIIVHALIVLGLQILVFFYVKWQPWFESYEDSTNKEDKDFTSYENTAVFILSIFLYISEAVVFSKGAPYRRTLFSNVGLVLALIGLMVFSLNLALAPSDGLLETFSMAFIPSFKFKLSIVLIALAHFFLAFIVESFLLDQEPFLNFDVDENYFKPRSIRHYIFSKFNVNRVKETYVDIDFKMRNDQNWPFVLRSDESGSVKSGMDRKSSFVKKSNLKTTNL